MAKKKKKVELKKVKAEIKVLRVTDLLKADALVKEGYKVLEIISEKKGDYKTKAIPKTWVLKK